MGRVVRKKGGVSYKQSSTPKAKKKRSKHASRHPKR